MGRVKQDKEIKHTSPKKPKGNHGTTKFIGIGITENDPQHVKELREARSKFNVSSNTKKRTYKGIVFDSELEMRYYRDVVVPGIEKDEIIYCELQKMYTLQPPFERNGHKMQAITYIGDFFLKYSDGHEELIDIKGFPDNMAKLKRKMFLYLFPEIDYKWISYSAIDGGWCEYDYILKQRAIRKRNKKLEGQLKEIEYQVSKRKRPEDEVLSKTKVKRGMKVPADERDTDPDEIDEFDALDEIEENGEDSNE